ncbi:carbohydrate porin [Rhizomicrobium electricum]|nr:carbohydrate porin [Rhizomicrobium electricum]NIJ50332.1 porin [Rhizomicrobium electricum]
MTGRTDTPDAARRRRRVLPMLAAAAIAAAIPGFAQNAATGTPDSIWTQDTLTGTWAGLRTDLQDRGVTLSASEVAETFSNTSGGRKTGTVFTGRAEFDLDLDLERLAGWRGATIHVNALQIHGRGLTADTLGGNLLDPSSIEANRATRLFDAYLEQKLFDDTLSIRIGQIAADDEFLLSDYAAALVNGTFGWAAIMAADLPNGGPGYPLSTPGVRVKWTPDMSFSWQTAVFNGDPAGDCSGNGQVCNDNGLTFSTDKDVFVISEIGYVVPGDLPASFKLGGWYHSGHFTDLRYDEDKDLAAVTGAEPYTRRGDYGFYAVIDKRLWREGESENQGLGGFFRVGAAPGDRNMVSFYADAGLSYIGLIEGHDNDVLALGFAYAKISDRVRDFDRDYNLANPSAQRPLRDYEAVVELSYSYVVAPWWTIQPDIQYIIHPAGHSADPEAPLPSPAMKNAFVIGLRTAIQI